MKGRGFAYSLDGGRTWVAGFSATHQAREAAQAACYECVDLNTKDMPSEILVAVLSSSSHQRWRVSASVLLDFGPKQRGDEGD